MTGAPVPIYQDRDFYVPQFEIKVGDRRLDREVIHDIISVTYRDDIEQLDTFEISINNWNGETRGFKYSDGDLFLPGKRLELSMGYRGHNGLRRMLTGDISSLRPSFPAQGQPALAISGLNVLHKLQTNTVSCAYPGKTDHQIANEIDQRLGVRIQTNKNAVGQSNQPGFLFQDNQYDINFLLERARRIGYEITVFEGTGDEPSDITALYFGPPQNDQEDIYKLEYGKSLIEFQPSLTTANQVYTVTVRGWHSVEGRVIEQSISRADIAGRSANKGDQEQIEQGFRERHEVIVNRPINSDEEAREMARSALQAIAGKMVKGSGSTPGLPDLRAGRYVQIEGLGERFTGRYFVTATTHTIDSGGYKTRFDCRREETGNGA